MNGSVTSLQKMSSRVKLYDLPHQGIGPALPTLHLCSTFKSSFIPKKHHTWGFQLLISHKQNPYTKINQLAVTGKIVSQPGIQLCVASVAVHHSCLIWTQIILVIHQRLQKYPSYIIVQWTSDPASRCFSV